LRLVLARLGLLFECSPPLAVGASPVWALHLEPVSARSARISRCPSLRNDAFEPKTVAVIEQHLAVWERLDLAQEFDARCTAKPIKIALALGARQASNVNAVLEVNGAGRVDQVQDVEHQKHQLGFNPARESASRPSAARSERRQSGTPHTAAPAAPRLRQ